MKVIYKFKNMILIFIFALTLTLIQTAFAEEGEAVFDSLVMGVIENTITHHYAEAESTAVQLTRIYPESPAGYFYRGGIISSMIFDYEQILREDDFKDYLDTAIDKAEKRIVDEKGNQWDHFYIGGAKGYLALMSIRKNDYFSAWIKGKQALKEFRMALEIDPELYDAYVGLGNYMYWVSKKTMFLEWTPFVKDRREEGIALMYETVQKGIYSKDTAASSLAWVLLDAERYEEALKVAEEPLKRYPDSRFFLFSNARTLYEMGRYEDSSILYEKLLNSVRSAELNNHFNEFGILQKLAENHFALKHYQKARDYAEAAIELPLPTEIKEEKSGKISQLKNIIKQCRKKMDN